MPTASFAPLQHVPSVRLVTTPPETPVFAAPAPALAAPPLSVSPVSVVSTSVQVSVRSGVSGVWLWV